MNEKFIKKLTEIVETNLPDENFTVSDLAREMGMSHSNLHRKIKRNLNKTSSQFIRETRLDRARQLLKTEDHTISEVAYLVGFGSPSYFDKCFHENYGYSPGEFKNMTNKEIRIAALRRNRHKQHNTLIIITIVFLLIIIASTLLYLFL